MGSKKITLVLIELAVNEPHDVINTKYMLDLQMMMMLRAQERTRGQWDDILAKAGFALQRVVNIRALHSIIEAQPV